MWGSVREDGEKGEESEVWRELIEEGVNGIIIENDNERERTGDFKGVYNTALHVCECVLEHY